MAASCPGISSVLDSHLHISLTYQGFFQCKLLISVIKTSESDPPSFWVENANYTLMRPTALSIPGQDESIACFLLRLSQRCFHLQLHAYLPCYNIQLLSLCCTDVQGQSSFRMGTNAPLQGKAKMQHWIGLETKHRHAQNSQKTVSWTLTWWEWNPFLRSQKRPDFNLFYNM